MPDVSDQTESAPSAVLNGAAASPLTEVEAREAADRVQRLLTEVSRVIVGQESMVRFLVMGLMTNGHVLLEGVPGLAKTLTVSTLAGALDARFSRIQFTPDLLPADLVGTLIYNAQASEFTTRLGPIFANIVLADEVNRAPAKVQSALLESMQERQVTIGDQTHPLPKPFLVLATMNPIEQEGAYPLPEAQLDRFLFKLSIGYPSRDNERDVVQRMANSQPLEEVTPVMRLDEVAELRAMTDRVRLDRRLLDYIVDLVHATREPTEAIGGDVGDQLAAWFEYGASPRGSIGLAQASRAHALAEGRAVVTPTDIKAVALPVLRHRVILSYEAEADGIDANAALSKLLASVPIP